MKELDVRSLACPGPVIEVKELFAAGESLLRLRVQDELARSNVTRFANSRGASVASESDGEGGFYVAIDGSQARLDPQDGEQVEDYCEIPVAEDASRAGPVVVQVSSDRMGEGDDELGALLMRSFLKTLLQLDPPPERILFYNGGVHLCCEGSILLEDLRAFEAQGVLIIACGTCLNFFGRADELRVGRGTDMLEIASWLAEAGKIIRP